MTQSLFFKYVLLKFNCITSKVQKSRSCISIFIFSEMFDDNVGISATQCFLRYLEYPENDKCHLVTILWFSNLECPESFISALYNLITFSSQDLQQTAVVIMAHLDRLALPHQPTFFSEDVSPNSIRHTPHFNSLNQNWFVIKAHLMCCNFFRSKSK